MGETFTITYSYKLKDGTTKVFPNVIDKESLHSRTAPPENKPLWALLNFHKCEICVLKEAEHAYCPVAENLAGIVEEFKNFVSHETAQVTVTTAERAYYKEAAIQQGLAPLLGIIMTTSGCPTMEQLKPMVRFHLPFASIEETIFRMVSMHLVAQYYRHQDGRSADFSLAGLMNIYADVSKVNRDFAHRMRAAASKDANVNALVSLDCFATMMPLAAEEIMKQFRPNFSALLDK